MIKKFKMQNLGCAHCASMMQDEISKLDGVNFANINYMMQKITLDISEDDFGSIILKSNEIVKKYEPDCSIIF